VSSVVAAIDPRALRAERMLGSIGLWGALLTLAVLAASVLLRLATSIDAAGNAVSSLPEAVETLARLAHRIAAMGVTVLALLAAGAAMAARPVPLGRFVAVVGILALTVFLAVIGRYTTGYKVPAVTLGNVVGGIALVCAFWWLNRQATRGSLEPAGHATAFAWLALAALLAQSGLGAATSALAMRGDRLLDPIHLAVGLLVVALTALAAWPHCKRRDSTCIFALGIAILAAFQFASGLFLAAAGAARPLAPAWIHALTACALGMGLIALAVRKPADRGTSPN
jgi:cytochrome c oxidase assembly protein subunit 15